MSGDFVASLFSRCGATARLVPVSRSVSALLFASIALLVWCMLLASTALAQTSRLIDSEPYDVIHLHGGKEVKVLQLDLPNRRLPRTPNPSQAIQARQVKDPTNNYRIFWRDIHKIDLFEQMVLREADKYVKAKKFDEAFDNFAYLYRNAPQTEGLQKSSRQLLIQEARSAFQKNKDDQALMLMLELYEQKPNHPGLQATLDRIGNRLVTGYIEQENYSRARQTIQLLKGKFPNSPFEGLDKSETKLIQLAGDQLALAQKHFAAKEYRQAKHASTRATEIWPDLSGVREFDRQVQAAYPQILVGVIQQAGEVTTERMDDWASRRSSRLLRRKLVELTDYTSEGGLYISPLGTLSTDNTGKVLSINLKDNVRWSSGTGVLTGHDVARSLLAMADPAAPAYSATWSRLLAGVGVQKVFNLRVELNRLHVRPESLLEISIDGVGPFAQHSHSGPFDIAERTDTEIVYQINKEYFGATPTQPQEIVEIQFENADQAVAALRRKQIDLVDKVPPRLLDVVRADRNLSISEYALPTVHVLIPNREHKFLSRIDFRHAICFAIDRQKILEQLILPGDQRRGFHVLSGPFPLGRGIDDPLGFAYDSQLAPRVFDPRTALLYVSSAQTVVARNERKEKKAEAEAKASKDGTKKDVKKKEEEDLEEEPPLPPMKPLILAYPASTTARDVCETIKKQLELVDIPCQTLELSPDDFLSKDLEYDLLYAELSFWEPVVDARRLLGPNGLTGGCSPYMSQALRKLDAARNWQQVRNRLRKVHQIAYREAAIIPLWQTVNYFGYRNRIKHLGETPITLYQNVEQWQVTPEAAK